MTYFRRTSFNDDARPRPQQTSMARRALASEQADATPLAVPVAASSDQWERQWGLESAQRVSTAEAAQGLINALIDVSARGSRNALKVRRARPETYRPTAKQWERWLDEPRRLIASWSSQARSAASCLGPHRPELRAALLELADRAQLLEDGYTEALRALARGVAPSGLEPGLQTEASNLHRALGQPVPHQDRLLQGPQELLRLRQRIAEELGPPKVAAARKTQATQGNIRALEAVNALSQLDVLTEMRSALEAAQKEHPRGVPPEVYLRGQSKNFEQLRQVETQLRALVPEFPRHRGMRAALEEAAGLAASIEPSYRAAAEAAWGRKNTLELDAPGAPRYARTIYTQMAETRRVMADTFPLALANQELQRQLGELRAWSEAARAQPSARSGPHETCRQT